MSPGKMASQAGHAFCDSILSAPSNVMWSYQADGHGTKVVLAAPDEGTLQRAYVMARDLHLPCALVVDSGHVMPPFFDGSPIVTALGIGPCRRDQVCAITKGLPLM